MRLWNPFVLLRDVAGNIFTITATSYTTQATASGDTTILTPSTGKKIRIKFLEYNNEDTTGEITVKARFGTGDYKFRALLVRAGGSMVRNLIGCNWEGSANEAFIINLDGAGTVNITVLYDEV